MENISEKVDELAITVDPDAPTDVDFALIAGIEEILN